MQSLSLATEVDGSSSEVEFPRFVRHHTVLQSGELQSARWLISAINQLVRSLRNGSRVEP